MKYSYLLLLVVIVHACTSKLYIVRHAEKSTEPKNDPNLTINGEQRAITLAELLKGQNIAAIYSTNTNRTKQTATPLSNAIGTTIQLYKNDTATSLLKAIFIAKKNTLIVGHSNTILPLLDSMNVTHSKINVPDWEYDNLFVVKYRKYCFNCAKPFVVKKVSLKKYGIASIAPTTAATMR